MYKLVVIKGLNVGTAHVIQSEGLSIGRQSGNTVVLASNKVSKQHCVFTADEAGAISIKDLGSSNGTFVNGSLIRQKKLKAKDRISVGEFIFELVESRVAQPNSNAFFDPAQLSTASAAGGDAFAVGTSGAGLGGIENFQQASQESPKDLKGKAMWILENQFLPIFYNLNLKNEWKMISVGLISAFILINLGFSVYPLLESNRESLVKETARRARFISRQIAESNAPILANRAETKADLGAAESAEGVRGAFLVDLNSRIIAPGARLNQYLTAGNEANVAIKARDAFRSGKETGFWQEMEDLVIAVEPVKVLNANLGRNEVVAMAIVSIDSSLFTLDWGEMGIIYSQTLILTGLLGLVLFFILYKVTLKPLLTLNEDMDKALKGEIPQVGHTFKFSELNALWDIINSAIQRVPKSGGGDGGGFGSSGGLGGAPGSEESAGPLKMLGKLLSIGFLLLDADRKIIYLNPVLEETSGIRLDAAVGAQINDVARDQSMGAFIGDLLNRVVVASEGLVEDYDFSGVGFKVHAGAIGQSGGSAKCFVLAFLKADA